MISILTLFLRRFLNGGLLEYLYILAFVWMGYVIIFSFLILLAKILTLFYPFEFKKVFIITCALSVFILFKSFYNIFKTPKVKEINIYSPYVSRNYKLVFISDIHLDFSFKNKLFSTITKKIEEISPDALIIGGDLFDPGFKLDEYVYRIKKVKFPVFFVFGNHEYYYGIYKSMEITHQLGFKVLDNSAMSLGDINIIGLCDIKTKYMEVETVKNIISKNYKKNAFNILVSHQPLYFKEVSEIYDILMLSGHTHCGQIFPFHLFTRIFYNYFCGEYKNKNSILFVSSGAGSWGPPLRFLSTAEILVINIVSDERN
ncbi:MAG: metallophosphoesterase [Elusimicrobiota bacterium]